MGKLVLKKMQKMFVTLDIIIYLKKLPSSYFFKKG